MDEAFDLIAEAIVNSIKPESSLGTDSANIGSCEVR